MRIFLFDILLVITVKLKLAATSTDPEAHLILHIYSFFNTIISKNQNSQP